VLLCIVLRCNALCSVTVYCTAADGCNIALTNFFCVACVFVYEFIICCFNSENNPPEERDEEQQGEGLTALDFDSNWDEAIETFDGMNLPEELLRGIYSYGFEKPSAIQQRAIKPTILGHDLIAQAQSGTVRCSYVCITNAESIACMFVCRQAVQCSG
jgi:hypothetical protein